MFDEFFNFQNIHDMDKLRLERIGVIAQKVTTYLKKKCQYKEKTTVLI